LRQADRVIFCFDGDNAGCKALAARALEAVWELRSRQQDDRLRFPPTED
ncbi:MAG: hypothetical protein IPG33_00005, partial [Betaproteobacteria bacterium]|nr:hypothetical protein [Betaproteobacteria bacterium]